jgi:hypothetical protein
MKDFLVQGSVVGAGAVIGTLSAWIFGGAPWIGAVLGGGAMLFLIAGVYLAVYSIIMGIKETFGG